MNVEGYIVEDKPPVILKERESDGSWWTAEIDGIALHRDADGLWHLTTVKETIDTHYILEVLAKRQNLVFTR